MTSDLRAPGDVAFVVRPVDHPDVQALLVAFHREQVDRYGIADSVALPPQDYQAPHGLFVVAYQHGVAVGCGGCRWYDRETATAEIKKTYLVPGVRGRGVGRALLHRLETFAVRSGADRIVLETGVRNTEALALFTASGYEPAPRYVPGRDPAINRAFAKLLTRDARMSATVR